MIHRAKIIRCAHMVAVPKGNFRIWPSLSPPIVGRAVIFANKLDRESGPVTTQELASSAIGCLKGRIALSATRETANASTRQLTVEEQEEYDEDKTYEAWEHRQWAAPQRGSPIWA